MTDNIQKLYELVGVPRIYSEFNNGRETVVENVFSPYRQLELIKLIGKDDNFLCFFRPGETKYGEFFESDWVCENYKISGIGNTFEQALADLVIRLWNEQLSEEQKQEIKRTLQ